MKEETLEKGVILSKRIAIARNIIQTCTFLYANGELDGEVILNVHGDRLALPASISKEIIPLLESYKEQLEKEFEEL